jgi:molecular chaperone DnaK
MVDDAKAHTAEDKKRREEIDTKNSADQLVYQTEKNLKEYGDKLDKEANGKIEAAVGRVKEAIKGSNVDEIRSATDALNQIWQEAASKMYAQSTASQKAGQPAEEPADQAGTKSGKGKTVEDADFEVVDDDKK